MPNDVKVITYDELVAAVNAVKRSRTRGAAWFWDHGVHIFPTKNKKPAVPRHTSQFAYRSTRDEAARMREYGVPGDGLTIVDTDDDADEAWIVAQPDLDTPFMVRTRRGWHRYFRTRGPLPSYIHRDGHTIENRNRGLYVVGPGSVLPDGFVYRASDWSWRWEDIPYFPDGFVFDDRPIDQRGSIDGAPYEFPDVVRAGERHDQLFRLLRSCKGKDWDRKTTREIVRLANERRCDPPLVEDDVFERWFDRQWNKPDRAFTPALVPLAGLRGV